MPVRVKALEIEGLSIEIEGCSYEIRSVDDMRHLHNYVSEFLQWMTQLQSSPLPAPPVFALTEKNSDDLSASQTATINHLPHGLALSSNPSYASDSSPPDLILTPVVADSEPVRESELAESTPVSPVETAVEQASEDDSSGITPPLESHEIGELVPEASRIPAIPRNTPAGQQTIDYVIRYLKKTPEQSRTPEEVYGALIGAGWRTSAVKSDVAIRTIELAVNKWPQLVDFSGGRMKWMRDRMPADKPLSPSLQRQLRRGELAEENDMSSRR